MTQLDLSQAIAVLRWLDEEHRKDKILIAELQKKIDEQKELSINQSRRIESFETRLTDVQESLVRFDRIDGSIEGLVKQARRVEELEALIRTTQSSLYRFEQIETNMQQTRSEANALIPKFEHALHEALAQAAQARAVERERDSRLMHELRKELEPLPDLERRLDALTLEDRRLNEQFPVLHSQLEKLSAALEAQVPRLHYLEAWGERLVSQITDLKLIEGRIKADHAVMLETIRRSEENQRQQLVQWSQEIVDHRKRVDDAIATLPPVDDAYEQARRVLAHLEGLDDEIRGEQQKIAHLLELSEERIRETLAEWRSEHEKNWEQHLTNFELYRKQQRELSDAITARLDALEQADAEQAERWHALREIWAEQGKRQLMEVERMQQELEAGVNRKRKRSIQ